MLAKLIIIPPYISMPTARSFARISIVKRSGFIPVSGNW
jgi:hypothetical protein